MIAVGEVFKQVKIEREDGVEYTTTATCTKAGPKEARLEAITTWVHSITGEPKQSRPQTLIIRQDKGFEGVSHPFVKVQ